jgi:vanillate/3-O-methylgallate O-demethylase
MATALIDTLRSNQPGYHPGWGPREFTDWRTEQMSWKTACYVGDWSFLWDLEFEGPDALRAFSDLSVNGFTTFAIGQAKHIVQCSPEGKVIGDGILMRTGEHRFRAQGIPALHTAWWLSRGGYDAQWTQLDTFQLQVSGPTALEVCRAATGQSLDDIAFMHFAEVEIAGVPAYALRQGMAGEVGFEFHGPGEHREAVIAALMAAGADLGIRRLGARTVMINHLEAAFPTGGWHYLKDSYSPALAESGPWMREHFDLFGLVPTLRGSFVSDDIGDYLASPVALGWGRSIRLDHDFVGREAIEKELQDPQRVRVTLEFDAADVTAVYASLFGEEEPYDQFEIPHNERWIAHADLVRDEQGAEAGISGTPGYSLLFRRILTLAFLHPRVAEPGTRVRVLWGSPGGRQMEIGATVRPAPYKKDNRRADLRTLAQPAR